MGEGAAQEPAPETARTAQLARGEFVAPDPWAVLGGTPPALPPVDAVAACFPDEVLGRSPELRDAGPGVLGEAREALEQAIALGEADAWAEPVRWILVARTTPQRALRDQAYAALVELARDFPDGRTRDCFRLEAGRLELLRQNHPEAAAWARRVEQSAATRSGDAATAMVDAARFLRAEALYLSGRHLQAAELYAALEDSAVGRLASGARFRGADLAADAGRPEAALPRYEELMPEASRFGASGQAWSARVGEAAFQAGEFASALAWFQRFAEGSNDPRERAIAEIRVADSAAILGKLPEARALLRDIVEHAADPAVHDLASVRLAVPPVGSRQSGEEITRLERAAGSPNPRVAQYARAELGRGRLEAGEAEHALEVLTRLAFERPDPILAPWLDVHLDDAIEATTEGADGPTGCRDVIRKVGWRREFLLRHSDRTAPFLTLGACYEEVGLPGQAIHLYRSLVRRFGIRVGEDVSLPLARAALGAGEVGVAKAAAEARVEAGAGLAWTRLLARVHVAAGNDRDALEVLHPALETSDASGRLRAESVWLLSVIALRLGELERVRSVLAAADPWLAPGAGLDDAQRGDLHWARAEAARRAGLHAVARRDYAEASTLLVRGTRRAAAEYWMGAFEDDPFAERDHYGAGHETDAGGLWAVLAGEELALSKLRERHGRPEALEP